MTDLIDAWPLEGPDDPASVDDELELRGFRRIGEWAPTLLGPSLGADEHVYPRAVVVESEDDDPSELT
ncbi:hypothetical protein [Phytoactinopolyspora halotolerans]|uniref:Uncharacterized protein n=1 Tax=Phytoactinopolyspora halotolerans TaxID=1981512 RepID=A0A6L9SGQ0_9ACTN|nr:hypothetical protein [Phytoactinopolyspora halotolerans]NEE03758.1 hypothetical protein [Phytoactinopolyspora halotolerans]